MKKTVEHLEKYMNHYHKNPNGKNYLFYITRKGNTKAMSPDNVGKFIKKYGDMARSFSTEVPDHLYTHMNTTLTYYANAYTKMKQETIENVTSSLNPLFSNDIDIDWEDDKEMIKKLCGLA
ncbi:hypothetical protein [Wukongibacter sp. M2B1]|uniref:hypothetical protein n=1 Tax=Wukongibacter sp. M2B1 TaxID=3088895 RepID=UPI003D79543E